MARKRTISASARFPPPGPAGAGLAVSVRLSLRFLAADEEARYQQAEGDRQRSARQIHRRSLVSGNRANAFSAASAMHKVIEITLRVAFGIISSNSC